MQMGVLKACFNRKRMKAPIEQAKDYLILQGSLSQFSGSIIKEMDNKNLKEKQIFWRWSSSLKWGRKKKEKKRITSEKTSFPREQKEILAASDKGSYFNQEMLKNKKSESDEKHGKSSSRIDLLEK